MIARAHVAGRCRRFVFCLHENDTIACVVATSSPPCVAVLTNVWRWSKRVGFRSELNARLCRVHTIYVDEFEWCARTWHRQNMYATTAVAASSTQNNNKTLQRDASYFSFFIFFFHRSFVFFSDLWGKIHHSITHGHDANKGTPRIYKNVYERTVWDCSIRIHTLKSPRAYTIRSLWDEEFLCCKTVAKNCRFFHLQLLWDKELTTPALN